MKKIILLLLISISLFSCKGKEEAVEFLNTINEINDTFYFKGSDYLEEFMIIMDDFASNQKYPDEQKIDELTTQISIIEELLNSSINQLTELEEFDADYPVVETCIESFNDIKTSLDLEKKLFEMFRANMDYSEIEDFFKTELLIQLKKQGQSSDLFIKTYNDLEKAYL